MFFGRHSHYKPGKEADVAKRAEEEKNRAEENARAERARREERTKKEELDRARKECEESDRRKEGGEGTQGESPGLSGLRVQKRRQA